jgi:hypothetical protein
MSVFVPSVDRGDKGIKEIFKNTLLILMLRVYTTDIQA